MLNKQSFIFFARNSNKIVGCAKHKINKRGLCSLQFFDENKGLLKTSTLKFKDSSRRFHDSNRQVNRFFLFFWGYFKLEQINKPERPSNQPNMCATHYRNVF